MPITLLHYLRLGPRLLMLCWFAFDCRRNAQLQSNLGNCSCVTQVLLQKQGHDGNRHFCRKIEQTKAFLIFFESIFGVVKDAGCFSQNYGWLSNENRIWGSGCVTHFLFWNQFALWRSVVAVSIISVLLMIVLFISEVTFYSSTVWAVVCRVGLRQSFM